jgi:formimidoylglutamate deiminase
LHNVDLDERWHMVHATHMTDAEVDAAARSQALAVLCPTTEANLGDGFFPADRWLAAGGRFGIGSDSNVTIDPCEELRLFEYARRLLHRRRSLAATESQPFPGARLWLDAASAMVPRSQQPGIGAIAPGMRADFLVLNAEHINLAGRSGDALFDALVFVSTPGASAIAENWIAGRRITQQGRHPKAEHARAAYARVLRELRSD